MKVTLKDIAKRLQLSVTTISKVINDHDDISSETKELVWTTIKEMNYVPNFMAANLRRDRGRLIGLVLSDISNPFFSKIIFGYEQTLAKRGYKTLCFNSYEDPATELAIVQQLITLNVAGILLDLAKDSVDALPALREHHIPYVLSARYNHPDRDHYVVADNELAGFIATKHLLERKPGRPVLCINGPDNISPTIDRFKGYKNALKDVGVGFEESHVFNDHYGMRDAYETAKGIARSLVPPFSVFCSTDQIALGCLRGFYDSGLNVPRDVGVIGVDGVESDKYIIPALSTIALPMEDMGRRSALMLVDQIEGREVAVPRLRMLPELQARETT